MSSRKLRGHQRGRTKKESNAGLSGSVRTTNHSPEWWQIKKKKGFGKRGKPSFYNQRWIDIRRQGWRVVNCLEGSRGSTIQKRLWRGWPTKTLAWNYILIIRQGEAVVWAREYGGLAPVASRKRFPGTSGRPGGPSREYEELSRSRRRKKAKPKGLKEEDQSRSRMGPFIGRTSKRLVREKTARTEDKDCCG